jgi:hypothetical protein
MSFVPINYELTYKGLWPEHSGDDRMLGMTSVPFRRGALALAALLSPSALSAQGCAMCYQSVAGSGSQFISALRHGILIMFFPPILIMGAIFYAAYRKRNQFNSAEAAGSDGASGGENLPPIGRLETKLVEEEP